MKLLLYIYTCTTGTYTRQDANIPYSFKGSTYIYSPYATSFTTLENRASKSVLETVTSSTKEGYSYTYNR